MTPRKQRQNPDQAPGRGAFASIVWPAVVDTGPAGMRDLLKLLDYSQLLPGEELREYQMSQLKAVVRPSASPTKALAISIVERSGFGISAEGGRGAMFHRVSTRNAPGRSSCRIFRT